MWLLCARLSGCGLEAEADGWGGSLSTEQPAVRSSVVAGTGCGQLCVVRTVWGELCVTVWW